MYYVEENPSHDMTQFEHINPFCLIGRSKNPDEYFCVN